MRLLPILAVTCCVSIACADETETGSGAAANAAGSGGSKAVAMGSAGSSAPSTGGGKTPEREVTCTDQSVSQLMLLNKPNSATIREESSSGGTFETFVDATAGGLMINTSFNYARFTDEGLKPVAISDEGAFGSLDWDIAFRRYLVRLNSGVSGPGDVTAARTRPMTTFESVESAPSDLEYRTESYYTDACDFVPDGSGLNAPATALASFWSYSQCVEMTHNVYVIALKEPKERHVKLEVMSYYTPENQQKCDDTGVVPMPTGAGNYRIRWAFLD